MSPRRVPPFTDKEHSMSTVQLWRVKVVYEIEVRGEEASSEAAAKVQATEEVITGDTPAVSVEVEAVKVEGEWYYQPPF
jgi:hypothetical protein